MDDVEAPLRFVLGKRLEGSSLYYLYGIPIDQGRNLFQDVRGHFAYQYLYAGLAVTKALGASNDTLNSHQFIGAFP